MESKTSLQQASQQTGIVQRARDGLKVAYLPMEIAHMDDGVALATWERFVRDQADAFVDARKKPI